MFVSERKRLSCTLRSCYRICAELLYNLCCLGAEQLPIPQSPKFNFRASTFCRGGENRLQILLRKEVIQPQVPLRLPCYDFIPVTSYTLGHYPLAVGACTSGATGFHDVTGGVYKTRERIHGAVDDAPLLAIPTSWRRVAASNPNWAQFYRFPPPRGLGSHCTGHCSTCAALGVRAILT